MPAYNDTIEDFNLKWGHTFIKVNDRVAFVHGAYYDDNEEPKEEETPRVYVRLIENGKVNNAYAFDFNSPIPIQFDAKFFNFIFADEQFQQLKQPGCLKIFRTSRRQNKRSCCNDNTLIVSPLFPLISRIKGNWPPSYDLNEENIKAALNSDYPPYLEALELCRKYGIIALSPNFAVSVSPFEGDKYLLSSLFGFIGEADHNNFYVKHTGSYQELRDFVTRHNVDVRVINAS